MRALIFTISLLLSSTALAQEPAPDPAPVPFTADERKVLLQMCEVARWASRIQFDTICEGLKNKFAEADKPKPEEKK